MQFSFIVPRTLYDEPFDGLFEWARNEGFTAVDFEADWTDDIVSMIRNSGVVLGPMRFRGSLADSDPHTRQEAVQTAIGALDRAANLGLTTVWTLPRNFRNDRLPGENFAAALESLQPMIEHAEPLGIRVAIENCPYAGQNPICTPEVWDALFDAIPSKSLGICFDPSHCHWQGIDIQRAIREYGDRIYHVHAKDTEIRDNGLFRYGITGPVLAGSAESDGATKDGWWRHRLPGLGGVDWGKFVTSIIDAGYGGPITIEHEDPLWSGSPDRVRRGLAVARNHLAALAA